MPRGKGRVSTRRCEVCGAVAVRITNSYLRKEDKTRRRAGMCLACASPYEEVVPDALAFAAKINRSTVRGMEVPFVSGGALLSGAMAT